MAFLRIRGQSISLVHGVRHPDRGVRHKRLHTFSRGIPELRTWLESDAWARLQIEIEQRHPDVAIDWTRLHQEATELADRHDSARAVTPPPTLEERVDALRRACIGLERQLWTVGKDSQDLRLLQCVGPHLSRLGRQIINQYDKLRKTPDKDISVILDIMLPDAESAEIWVDRGRHAASRGKLDQARRHFDNARGIDPCDPDIDNSEAIGYLEQAHYEEASILFEKARDLAYLQLPHRKKAYAWSQHEVRPYIRATCNLALVRERQGRFQEALDLYEECLRRCPQDGIGARFHLGPIHQRLGNFHRAIDFNLEHCRGNLMDIPDPFYDMASALFQLHRPADALDRLLEGIEINYHIPASLLKRSRRRATERHAAVDSLEWAQTYVQENGDLWPQSCRTFLEQVWKDGELQKRIRTRKQLEADVEVSDRDGRGDAMERLFAFRSQMFPEDWVQELKARTLKPA